MLNPTENVRNIFKIQIEQELNTHYRRLWDGDSSGFPGHREWPLQFLESSVATAASAISGNFYERIVKHFYIPFVRSHW